MLFNLVKCWLVVLLSLCGGSGRRRPNRFIPMLEGLEGRVVPTAYTWTGAADLNASNAANWVDNGGGHAVPTATDTILLTGSNPAYNRPLNFDAAFGGAVGGMTIDSSYTQQVTLQENLTCAWTTQNGGTIAGPFSFIVPNTGVYNWYGGTLAGAGANALIVVQSGAGFFVGAGNYTDAGRTIQNFGYINWDLNALQGAQSTITLSNQAVINNEFGGTFTTGTAQTDMLASGDGTGGLTNSGLFSVGNGADVQVGVELTGASKAFYTLQNAQSFLLVGDATFDSGTINGTGTLAIGWEATITGTLTVSGATLDAYSNSIINLPGTLTVGTTLPVPVAGTLILNGATVAGAGQINLVVGVGNAQIVGGATLDGITFNNNDTVTWLSGDLNLAYGATFNNNVTFKTADNNQANSMSLTSTDQTGSFYNYATFNKQGIASTVNVECNFADKTGASINLNGGFLMFPTSWTLTGAMSFNSGQLLVEGTFTILGVVNAPAGGTIRAAQVTNDGTIDLTSDLPVTLAIARLPGANQGGNYVQGSAAALWINMTGDGVCNQLAVAGNATLAGSLILGLANGYQPGPNQTWQLMTFGTNQNNTTYAVANVLIPEGFDEPVYPAGSVQISN